MKTKRTKKETKDMLRDIIKMRKKGMTLQQVGDVFGISRNAIFYHLKKNEEYILENISSGARLS